MGTRTDHHKVYARESGAGLRRFLVRGLAAMKRLELLAQGLARNPEDGRRARLVAVRLFERAFDLGCPYTYSLLPDGASSEASSNALNAISRFYWPHPIPPRREPARPGSVEPDASLDDGPAHLVGWRRIRP